VSETLHSPSWYRVAGLKPRIRVHAQIHRHAYRGEVWFVMQDHASGRSHRFSPAAHQFIGLMDGERTVQELWDAACLQLGDDAPTQEDVIRMLGQLHAADALLCDVPPDSREVFQRFQKQERMEWKRRFWTPLALRFPLLDPDRFLERTMRYVEPLFGWLGIVLWLGVVATGAVLAGVHWRELTENIADRVLAPQNLLTLWLVYPVVKALHELGHAYATKRWGGEVHEIGIMLLVLTPVPYVDATAAWGFRDKRRRMVVGAAGIAVELFLGALALFVWLNAQPGVVHAIAYNVVLITGVSTLLFNGNPLLRFDGYYVFSDAVEIPNLGTRANRYLGYLAQRYLFGVRDAQSPAESRGERNWMAIYGVASFAYRVFIMFVIVLFIAGKFFTIGVLLAIWAVITQIAVPVWKAVAHLTSNPALRRRRQRAVGVSTALVVAVLLILFVVPAPSWTRAEGVVWVPEEAQVRAGTDGFVERVVATPDSVVARGDALIEAADPLLPTQVAVLEAQLLELEVKYDALMLEDRVQAALVREEMVAATAALARSRERAAELMLKSGASGRFVLPNAGDLPGRFVAKGQLVGYVVEPKVLTVRVAVGQDDIARVRERIRDVEVMMTEWGASPVQATIRREVPGGSQQLPTAALGSGGGGPFAVDPRDRQGVTALERVFQLELVLPEELRSPYLGARVFVRFNHGFEPIGLQAYRALRRLFLRRFDV
jgi:putative peptide zinc metalloprotease protein